MRYYKATINNGYCGCEEVELFPEPDNVNVDSQYALDLLQNYSFYEADSRFIDEDNYKSEEEYRKPMTNIKQNVLLILKSHQKKSTMRNVKIIVMNLRIRS